MILLGAGKETWAEKMCRSVSNHRLGIICKSKDQRRLQIARSSNGGKREMYEDDQLRASSHLATPRNGHQVGFGENFKGIRATFVFDP
jgi:hypothetical protein